MPTEQIAIRNATPADAAVLDALIRQLAAHEGAAHLISFTPAQIAAALGNERLRAILAEDGEGVCGFVTFTVDFAIWNGGDILRVDDVFVSERARGCGIGRQLMLRVAQLALDGNMIARWEVEPVNLAARRFYLGLGANLRDKIVARWERPAMAGAVGSTTKRRE